MVPSCWRGDRGHGVASTVARVRRHSQVIVEQSDSVDGVDPGRAGLEQDQNSASVRTPSGAFRPHGPFRKCAMQMHRDPNILNPQDPNRMGPRSKNGAGANRCGYRWALLNMVERFRLKLPPVKVPSLLSSVKPASGTLGTSHPFPCGAPGPHDIEDPASRRGHGVQHSGSASGRAR